MREMPTQILRAPEMLTEVATIPDLWVPTLLVSEAPQ